MDAARRRAGSGAPGSPRVGPSKLGGPAAASSLGRDSIPINSPRDADQEFAALAHVFAGKETEDNWERRDDALRRLRALMRSAPGPLGWAEDPATVDSVVAGVRRILDDVLTASLSLRTALVVTACSALAEVVATLGRLLDPVSEPIITTMSKLIGSTKKLVHSSGAATAATVLVHCSLKPRVLDRVATLVDDKNTQVRSYAMQLLYEVLAVATPDSVAKFLDVLERAIKKAVSDSNAQVREVARDCYWEFERIAPSRASTILNKMEPAVRKILAKGPGKSRPSLVTAAGASPGSAAGTPTTPAAASPTLGASTPPRSNSLPARGSSLNNVGVSSPLSNSSEITGGLFGSALSVSMPASALGGTATITSTPASSAWTAPRQSPPSPAPARDRTPSSESGSGSAAAEEDGEEADDENIHVWLEAYEDALAGQEYETATQCLAYMLHMLAEASARRATGDPESEDALDAMAPAVRQAVLAALASAHVPLTTAALDDPALLWSAAFADLDDAVDLVVALADASAMFPRGEISAVVAETREEALRTLPSDRWISLLARALDAAAGVDSSVFLGHWIEAEDPDAIADWMERHDDEGARLAQRIQELAPPTPPNHEYDDDDGSGARGKRLIIEPPIEDLDEPARPVVSPIWLASRSTDAAAPEDPVEDLVLAMADARVTLVELYRFTAHVRTAPPPAGALVEHLQGLLHYAATQGAGAGEGDDLAAECVLAAHHVLAAVPPEYAADALAVLLAAATQIAPASPIAYWLDQCVAGLLVPPRPGGAGAAFLDQIVRFTAAAVASAATPETGSDAIPAYANLLGYIARALESSSSPSALPRDTRDALESVLRTTLRSPESFVRLAAVKVAAAWAARGAAAGAERLLDELVASSCMDPVHRRLVAGYAARQQRVAHATEAV
ncbi:suppressor of tub2 mutation [Blastocladiella emersonii ATCC 22665]|nr:suppressor of tub2 mutation [Blastocladiella emersonii ATCC 22665]